MEDLQRQINELKTQIDAMKSYGTFPYEVDSAIQERLNIARFEDLLLLPSALQDAPLASIASPTGGTTQDTEARTAINTVISRLNQLGLIS